MDKKTAVFDRKLAPAFQANASPVSEAELGASLNMLAGTYSAEDVALVSKRAKNKEYVAKITGASVAATRARAAAPSDNRPR